MPMPFEIVSFNEKVRNRRTAPFTGCLPGFPVVVRRGRTCGSMNRTSVNAFRRYDDDAFVMMFSSDVGWVRNVDLAGRCDVEMRHRVQPRRFGVRFVVPCQIPERMIVRFINVDGLMAMHTA
jgi:hypothetical protein